MKKQGNQKKLDERAMKNESIFAANDVELQNLIKKFDAQQLREKYKNVITEIGGCSLTQCDVAELLVAGDCMCLALDISRSEAAINDPSKLQINRIIPTFMSMDSFLDSSIINL